MTRRIPPNLCHGRLARPCPPLRRWAFGVRCSAFAILLLTSALCLLSSLPATAQTTRPTTTDPALWTQLVEIDHRASQIKDLSADFTQQKHTPLLRKPLTSTGTIRVKGDAMLWDTRTPQPTKMRIDPAEIRLYYPDHRTLEIYPVTQQLGSLAASPLPKLDVLTRYFSFTQVPITSLADDVKPDGMLALKLTPTDPALAQHLDHVLVLLDSSRGLILRAQMTDADGDRTHLVFSNIRANTGLQDHDVSLSVPESTKVTRPLDGLGASPPAPPSRRN